MIKLTINVRASDGGRSTIISAVYFNEVNINLKYDSIASTFKLKMFFDPGNPEHAELSCVSHIHECKIYYVHDKPGRYAVGEKNGTAIFGTTTDELLMTGFMLSHNLFDSSKPSWVEIGGYSKPGTLGDCDFPTKAYPLESVGLSFRQIVQQKVLPYFSNPKDGGFKFHIKSSRADSVFTKTADDLSGGGDEIKQILAALKDDLDETIEKTTALESKNILSYLKELAVQKGLILSTDIFGNLVVNAAYTGNDYLFEIGTGKGIKYVDINCNYNGQGLHSDIEVVGQAPKDGGNMPYALITNPLVPIVYRPKVITITAGTDNDCLKAGLSELGTELKSVPLRITLEKPVANGKFIMPNNTILVKSRECYLYEPSKWFIEEVNYSLTPKEEKCEITAVLPGVYGGPIINVFVPPGKNLPDIRR